MKLERLVLAGIVLSIAVMLLCCVLLYLRQPSQEPVSYAATIIPFS
ncbi:MAG: hypothetical protein IK095_08940 [Oscillospiraceae bacterium]|nr:hypothetical protein [Oscillospiraceae bacterium]